MTSTAAAAGSLRLTGDVEIAKRAPRASRRRHTARHTQRSRAAAAHGGRPVCLFTASPRGERRRWRRRRRRDPPHSPKMGFPTSPSVPVIVPPIGPVSCRHTHMLYTVHRFYTVVTSSISSIYRDCERISNCIIHYVAQVRTIAIRIQYYPYRCINAYCGHNESYIDTTRLLFFFLFILARSKGIVNRLRAKKDEKKKHRITLRDVRARRKLDDARAGRKKKRKIK